MTRDPWHGPASIRRGIEQARAAIAEADAAFDLAAWADRVMWWNRELRRAATPLYERFDRDARQLTVARITAARDLAAVERVEAMLRAPSIGSGWRDLWRVFDRRQLGELVAAATNRARMLRLGRLDPKPRGPRLDPRRLPDDRLDALIQRHRDLAVVEALRAERRRRLEGNP